MIKSKSSNDKIPKSNSSAVKAWMSSLVEKLIWISFPE